MKRPRHLALALALAACRAIADESAPPPAATGIAAVKADYKAIKEAGTPAVQQKLAMPEVPTVDFK